MLFSVVAGIVSGCAGEQATSGSSQGSAAGDASSQDETSVDYVPTGDDAAPVVPGVDASAESGESGDAADAADASPAPPFDAGPDGVCARPLAPGDLAIDEIMIASVAGTGDHGEWLEVRNTLGCAIDIVGLHGECPHGSRVATFDVSAELWLPANGTFVVADSNDPAQDHYLPGTLVVWFGSPGDVLRNKGDTIALTLSGTLIDSVTYPSLPATVGASLSFPADCPPAARSDWGKWHASTTSWFPGFAGTPNAPNVDVRCN